MYESRLELTRLLVAEFNPLLLDVREQTFHLTLRFRDGLVIRHIPDFLFTFDGQPPHLVNVKPPGWEHDAKLRLTFETLASLCAEQGWSYETWTGESLTYIENLRWLAAYRRRSVIPASDEEILTTLDLVSTPMSIGDLEQWARGVGVRNARSVVLHLLWMSVLRTDLSVPLSAKSEVSL
jgi:hypothetical protein